MPNTGNTLVYSGRELRIVEAEILPALNNLKSEFSARLDGILTAVKETRKELVDCTERITQMEVLLSTIEVYRNRSEIGKKK